MDVVQLISAAGIGDIIGSVITTLLQSWIANNQRLDDRKFQEKKEAYLGLLDAYRNVATSCTKDSSLDFAYWIMRCNLVSPSYMKEAITNLENTKSGSVERAKALETLANSMSKALDIQ